MSLKVDDLELDGGYKVEICFDNGRARIDLLGPDGRYISRVEVSQPKGSDVALRINDPSYPHSIILADTSDDFDRLTRSVAEVHREIERAKSAGAPYRYSIYHRLMADQAVLLTKDNGDGTFMLTGSDQAEITVPGTDSLRLWNYGL